MKYSELWHTEWYHYLSKYELPIETSWGIPFLSWENEVLKLIFCPHKVRLRDGRILVFSPECKIRLDYPFGHLDEFIRYHGRKTEMVCSIDVEWLKGDGKKGVQELSMMFDNIMESMAVSQEKTVYEVRAYQEKIRELFGKLNLQDFYREAGL